MKLHEKQNIILAEIPTAIKEVKEKRVRQYAHFSTKITRDLSVSLKRIQKKEGLSQSELLEIFVNSYYKEVK